MSRQKKIRVQQNKLLIAFIIISLVSISYAFYKFSLQPPKTINQLANTSVTKDEIKNWKTYTNVAFRFTFLYPKEWKLGEYQPNGTNYISVINVGENIDSNNDPHPASAGIHITIFEPGYYMGDVDGQREIVNKDTDLIYFTRAMNGLLPDEFFSKATQQSRLIDGNKAISYLSQNGVHTPWYLKKYQNIYQISTPYYGTNKEEVNRIYDSIINSFHFN